MNASDYSKLKSSVQYEIEQRALAKFTKPAKQGTIVEDPVWTVKKKPKGPVLAVDLLEHANFTSWRSLEQLRGAACEFLDHRANYFLALWNDTLQLYSWKQFNLRQLYDFLYRDLLDLVTCVFFDLNDTLNDFKTALYRGEPFSWPTAAFNFNSKVS
jgi:hypothetical protein